MKMFFLVMSLFSCLNAFADISIQTIDGKTATVSENAIETTYYKLIDSKFNLKSRQPDGSIAFSNPGVMIAGKMYAVGFSMSSAGPSPSEFAKGFCKANHFGKLVAFSAARADIDRNPDVLNAWLNADGSVQRYSDYLGMENTFQGIICRP